jgi:SAM-dependent methyltransferase
MARSMTLYDEIGKSYGNGRRSDPRIAARIEAALGDAITVVNVGAGAGSYESSSRRVVAVEPSETMIRQRPADAAPAIVGVAEALPLCDRSVDAATAFLTIHHWSDPDRGLAEMRRVARKRAVLLTYVPGTYDPDDAWLTRYFPSIAELDRRIFPALDRFVRAFGSTTVCEEVLVPHDCIDGFLHAFWARPETYLDPAVRAGMSGFQRITREELDGGLARLRADLESGAWDRAHGALRAGGFFDAGLRLISARWE